MKVVVNQKNLRKALNVVEKIVSRNTSLPILRNILIKTDNGRLKLSATNLEIGVNYIIGAKISAVGEIAVPARIFYDFINGINDEKISLFVKNNILSVNSKGYKTQILGFDTKDFPIIPKIGDKTLTTIPIKVLKNTLISVFDSIALSGTRPELAGVFMNFKKDNAVFVTTDSSRLSEKTINIKSTQSVNFILPRNTVTELIRISGELEDDLSLNISDSQVSFSNNDFELISRIVDGNYPDYEKVIPSKFLSKVLIKKEDLERKIRLTGLFSSNISDIKINCFENETQLIAKNPDKGEIEIKISSVLKNQPFEVSLNFHYLLDGLKNINTDKAIIEFTGQGSPIILKPGDNSKDFIYLIMPLRN